MKIALVNHTFPPHSFAGSEKCVFLLARELQQRGHSVAVFFRVDQPDLPEYELVHETVDDIPTTAINHTYRHVHTFADIYHNSVIGARFGAWLGEFRPDVVHFHHLTNLSLSLVDEARQRGCKTVMTLHDYWLLCQRGQLLKDDLSLCTGPSPQKCRSCLAPQLVRGRTAAWGKRLQRWAASWRGSPGGTIDLSRCEIDTPNRNFVGWTQFGNGDAEQETLLMHPPSSVRIPVSSTGKTHFRSHVGLHPDMVDKPGAGVVFSLEAGGEELHSVILNPKQNPDEQGWHTFDVELPAVDAVTLVTRAQDGKGEFCSAGWHCPRIEMDAPQSGPIAKERSWVHRMANALVHITPSAYEGISHRQNWVQRVFDGVDHFISPSEFLHDFFIDHGMDKAKISVLPNGFPEEASIERKVSSGPIRFGYLGTWIPSKGIDLLVDAFRDVSPEVATLSVHGFFPGYAGYEDYEERIRAMAGPAVQFVGRYDADEVRGLLATMDCLVVPSIWYENSPMTIQEAFQAGVPVLTADVGGMAEQVRDGGGWTFRHRDGDDLSRVIEGLIQQPQTIEAMRSRIPAVPGIEDQSSPILAIYEGLLSGGTPG